MSTYISNDGLCQHWSSLLCNHAQGVGQSEGDPGISRGQIQMVGQEAAVCKPREGVSTDQHHNGMDHVVAT